MLLVQSQFLDVAQRTRALHVVVVIIMLVAANIPHLQPTAGVKRELLDTVKARKLAYFGHATRKRGSCVEKEMMQGTMPGARRRGRPRTACWWTTSRRGQDCLWKSQSEWQRTVIHGESTSMVWPTLGSRTATEQNNRQTHNLVYSAERSQSSCGRSNRCPCSLKVPCTLDNVDTIFSYQTSNRILINATLLLVHFFVMSKFYVFVLCLRVCIVYTVFFIDNVALAGCLCKHVHLSRVFYNKLTCTYLLTYLLTYYKSVGSASYVALNKTLLAFAAERRAAVFMDRKAAAPAADAPCSSRSISPARGAHSSKPAALRGRGARWDRQTDEMSIAHDKALYKSTATLHILLQRFDTVGWEPGRVSGR